MSEYYQHYLTLHTHPKCRLLHFIGVWATILYTGAIVAGGPWAGLALVPFVVYPFAWSGHYFFEKNKPAAFGSPLKAKAADFMMFWDILRGRLSIW